MYHAYPSGEELSSDYSLINGGAMVAVWGWIIMSLITICIAVSLGEIASRYPVSGGTYYWTYMLSTPRWAPITSWIVGWLSVIGNITVTLTANFGLAIFTPVEFPLTDSTTQLILASVNSTCQVSHCCSQCLIDSILPRLRGSPMAHSPVLMGTVS